MIVSSDEKRQRQREARERRKDLTAEVAQMLEGGFRPEPFAIQLRGGGEVHVHTLIGDFAQDGLEEWVERWPKDIAITETTAQVLVVRPGSEAETRIRAAVERELA